MIRSAMMRAWGSIAIVTLLSAVARAPGAAPATQPAPDFSETWLLHLPGIAGELHLDRDLIAGLKDGGWEGPTQIYDWTEHDPGLSALLAHKRNAREARKVADMIVKRCEQDPRIKITLTSHSGGTGIAVWALEDLPDHIQVETLVLLASALSPGYDLTKALSHVRGNAYVFYSEGDSIVLGTGTMLFGTIDGVKSRSGGLIGFTAPPTADKDQYAKLIQKRYDRGWMVYGHIGDHIGSLSRPFAQKVLEPILAGALDPGATTRPTDDGPVVVKPRTQPSSDE